MPHFTQLEFQCAHPIIVHSPTLLAEYAYVLRPGGIVYTITDVHDLHVWMASHLTAFPLFEPIPAEELVDDPVIEQVYDMF